MSSVPYLPVLFMYFSVRQYVYLSAALLYSRNMSSFALSKGTGVERANATDAPVLNSFCLMRRKFCA